MRIHLVRHGRSATDPTRAAKDWGLHEDAAAGIHRLRDSGALPGTALWFTSSERKAVETAALLGARDAVGLDGIREAERSAGWLPGDEFGAAVRRSFERPEQPAVPGWEPLAATRARVVDAVRSTITTVAQRAAAADIALVGHGTAWTMLVSELTGTPADLEAWARLSMPDHCSLDLDGSRPVDGTASIASRWGSWDDPAVPP
ncbi:MAG: histidine phosphatase family protein [Nocardioidaceae bacterium]|nr:histidine phosphatase family protein [Nocardioidaceae bacterium]